jgi:ribose transport system permease protein
VPPTEQATASGRALLERLGGMREASMIWIALLVLVVVCALFEPSTLKGSAILSMLPFAAILAIASVGQCLVIQQGGIDFSVVGSITLSAAVVTGHAGGDGAKLLEAILMALGVVLIAGLINGIAVTMLRITPIIATLATNALLLGAVQSYTNGIPKSATKGLSEFAIDKTLGIPNTVYLAAIFVAVAAVVLAKTVVGRRFIAIGANPDAAKAAGLRVNRYLIGTYMLAALCYGAAGIVLAGYVKTPGTTVGNPYLLSTITAVVVGGTALGGGRGRVVGAAIAAVFLSQLESFISATGAPPSVSLLVQSAAIAVAVGFSSSEAASSLRRLFAGLQPRRARTRLAR